MQVGAVRQSRETGMQSTATRVSKDPVKHSWNLTYYGHPTLIIVPKRDVLILLAWSGKNTAGCCGFQLSQYSADIRCTDE
jgi:hypothetical protein